MSVLVRAVVFLRWIVLGVYLGGFKLLEIIYLSTLPASERLHMQEVGCLFTYAILAEWRREGGGREVRTLVVAWWLYWTSVGEVKYRVSQENADCWLDRRSAKLIDLMDDIPGRRRVEKKTGLAKELGAVIREYAPRSASRVYCTVQS